MDENKKTTEVVEEKAPETVAEPVEEKATEAEAPAEEKVAETKAAPAEEKAPEAAPAAEKAPEAAPAAAKAPEKKAKKGSKAKWGILIGIVVALIAGFVLLVGIILAIILWPKKIDMNDYVTVQFTGYDTIGNAQVIVDEIAFMEKYGDKIKFSRKAMENPEFSFYSSWGYSPAEVYLDLVTTELSQRNNLSNGQEVTLTWPCQDDAFGDFFNYGLKCEEETYVVEGLQAVQMFDPFENIELQFSGIAPNGQVQIIQNDFSGVYSDLYYYVDNNYNLSNGDTVKVTLGTSYWTDTTTACIENYGICPSATEKEYTVEGLEYYVTSLDEIDIDALNAMIAQGQDNFNAYVANGWGDENRVDSFVWQGSYMLTPKPGRNDQSYVYMVYKVNATWKFTNWWWDEEYYQPVEFYYVVRFDAPVVNSEGVCVADVVDYYVPYSEYYYEYTPDGEDNSSTLYTRGYATLDDFVRECITTNIEYYNYETDIQ